ncbi:dCTP deaminase [Desulfurococcaceae archaeon AG1]|nr:dCTP deaminase [Desulfurococcaceae archaeon AG1]
MILSDFDLRSYIASGRLYIEPFWEGIVRENGLDLRLGSEVCEMLGSDKPLDPYGEWDPSEYFKCYETNGVFQTKPWGRYLMHTLEYIRLPPELAGFVELRSTFARLGFIIPPTLIDGGFEGQLTIEVQAPPFPVSLRAGTRFLHVILSKVSTPIERPYRGAYQGQRGVRLPKKLEYP